MSKLPIGFIADPHVHSYKNHSTINPNGMNSRLAVILDAIGDAADVLRRKGGKTLFIAGDVFHVRGNIKPSVLNAFVDCLNNIVGFGIDVVIIPGNHDMEHLSGGDTAVDVLTHIPGVRVYQDELRVMDIDGWRVALIPYVNSTDKFKELVKSVSIADVIVCHQGIDNFKPNSAMPDCGVTAEWLDKNTKALVFAGHYHHSRRLNGIHSIGAIVQHDFSSEGEDRGVHILHPDGSFEFHPIESPKFITIDATGKKVPKIPSVAGNYVRILAKTVAAAKKVSEEVQAAGAASIVTHIEKEFTKSKTETIKMDNPEIMISQFIDVSTPKYDGRKSEILDAYRRLP